MRLLLVAAALVAIALADQPQQKALRQKSQGKHCRAEVPGNQSPEMIKMAQEVVRSRWSEKNGGRSPSFLEEATLAESGFYVEGCCKCGYKGCCCQDCPQTKECCCSFLPACPPKCKINCEPNS